MIGIRARFGLIAAGVIFLLGACVRFHAQPLGTETGAAALMSRSLKDPDLSEFLRAGGARLGPEWTFNKLVLAAFYFNSELSEARAKLAVCEAEQVTAGERPNPTLNLTPERITHTMLFPWTLGGSVDLPIETAGKRRYRMDQARNLAAAARLNLVTTAWQVRSRVRKNFVDTYAGREIGHQLHLQQEIQIQGVRIIDAQLKAGAVSAFQVAQAHTALNQVQLAIGNAERQAAEAQVNLAQAIGISSESLRQSQLAFPNFNNLPAAPDARSAQRHALLHRADVLAALSEYVAAQSALQLAVAKQYPDIHLGPGYQLDQNINRWALGLSVELPILNQHRGAIAEAEAHREQAAAHFMTVQTAALADVDRALAGYRAARNILAAANAQVSELRKEEQSSRTMLQAGEISQADLAAIQLQVSAAELARLDALVKAQQVLGDLQDALQGGFGFSELSLATRLPAGIDEGAR